MSGKSKNTTTHSLKCKSYFGFWWDLFLSRMLNEWNTIPGGNAQLNKNFSKLSSHSLHYVISCLLFNIHKTVRALFENNQYVFIPLLYKINSDHFLVLPLPFMLYTISYKLQAAVLKGKSYFRNFRASFWEKILITICEI